MPKNRAPILKERLPENLTTQRLLGDAQLVTEKLVNLVSRCCTQGKAHSTILVTEVGAAGETEDPRWISDLGHTIQYTARRRKKGKQLTTEMRLRMVPSADDRINVMEGLEPELVNSWKRRNGNRGNAAVSGLLEYLQSIGSMGNRDIMFDMSFSGHPGRANDSALKRMRLQVRMKDQQQEDRVSFTFDSLMVTQPEEKSDMDPVTRTVYRRAIDELQRMLDIEEKIVLSRLLEIACRSGDKVLSTINESAGN